MRGDNSYKTHGTVKSASTVRDSFMEFSQDGKSIKLYLADGSETSWLLLEGGVAKKGISHWAESGKLSSQAATQFEERIQAYA